MIVYEKPSYIKITVENNGREIVFTDIVKDKDWRYQLKDFLAVAELLEDSSLLTDKEIAKRLGKTEAEARRSILPLLRKGHLREIGKASQKYEDELEKPITP